MFYLYLYTCIYWLRCNEMFQKCNCKLERIVKGCREKTILILKTYNIEQLRGYWNNRSNMRLYLVLISSCFHNFMCKDMRLYTIMAKIMRVLKQRLYLIVYYMVTMTWTDYLRILIAYYETKIHRKDSFRYCE
jgi:hypothetical protein